MLSRQEQLRIFCVAAEAESFREAAARLEISPQSITRAVKALEAHYGELLFHRTTRSLRITDFGAELVPRVRACLSQLDVLLAPSTAPAVAEPVGRVRVTAPRSLGRLRVLPVLNEVARRHPGLVIDIRLSDELADVVDSQIDIGVRMGFFKDNRFAVRKVGGVGFGVYGSRALIRRFGAPRQVADLAALPTTGLIDQSTGRPWHWFFSKDRRVLPEPFAFVTDDPEAECDAVLSGVAFGQLPDYLAERQARAKRLIRVLEAEAPPPWDIYVYRPQRGAVPMRVRLVFDAIAQALTPGGHNSGKA